jgi:type II secretory ATPase GspE/PulE/Tfp pilus assembly ATPase PilB-like protein
MIRLLIALVASALLWTASAPLLAQAPAPAPDATAAPKVDTSYDANWPTYPFATKHQLNRGPGWYIALWKVFLVFLVFLMWVRTTDWVSRDCSALGMNYDKWNSIVFFPFLLTFVVLLFIPFFLAGFPLLIIAYAVPLSIYVRTRNSLVPDGDKVLTKEHIRYLVANAGKLFGAKIEAEKKMGHEKGPPVTFSALGAENEQKNQANIIEARQSPAYVTLKEIVADAVAKRAEKVLFDYTAQNVGMKYQIDGVWLDLPAREREASDPIAAVMKKLCNLNIADRKSKQEGAFAAEYQGTKYMCPFVSQGTATGERIILTLAGKAQKFNNLDELGMREKMRDQLKGLLTTPKGIIVFCSMPQGGLSNTMAMALKSTDRLMRDFAAVGDKTKHEPEVENVEFTPFNAAAGETPMTVLRKIILRQPDVLVIRELSDGDTLQTLVKQCTDEHPKLSIATIRAKEAVEALVRLVALKVPAEEFAPELICVVNTRLMRKLCDKCKEAYEPSAEMLAKLGIPAGRVQQLYRERQPLPPESKEKRPPCSQCSDIGYFGRTAVFELLVMTDKLREALIKQPQLETLKKVAKAGGHRSLQDEGIVLVALGVTSLTELQRVLKQ